MLQVSLVFLCMLTCSYAYSFSAPAILQALTAFSNRNVGFLVAAISLLGVPSMLLNAMHSDRTKERYLHVAIPFLVMTGCYVISGSSTAPLLVIPALALATLSYFSLQGPVLALATSFLEGQVGRGRNCDHEHRRNSRRLRGLVLDGFGQKTIPEPTNTAYSCWLSRAWLLLRPFSG